MAPSVSKPHSSYTDAVVAGLLRRKRLGSLYLNDVRFLDARIKRLEEEMAGLEEQLEIARKALAFFDPDDDADAAIAFARRLNPEWDSASAPVDGHPCKGQGAEYLVEQDNANPAEMPVENELRKDDFRLGEAEQIARAYIWQGEGMRGDAVDAFDLLMDRLNWFEMREVSSPASRSDDA